MSGCAEPVSTSNLVYTGSYPACFASGQSMGLNQLLYNIMAQLCASGNQPGSGTPTADQIFVGDNQSITQWTEYIEGLCQDIQNSIPDQFEPSAFDQWLISEELANLWNNSGFIAPGNNANLEAGNQGYEFLSNIMHVLGQLQDCCDQGGFTLESIGSELIPSTGGIVGDSGGEIIAGTGLSATVRNPVSTFSTYIVENRAVRMPSTSVNLTANSDNYVDVSKNGFYVVTPVAISDPAPPEAGLRLGYVRTGAVSVASITDLRVFEYLDASKFVDDFIQSRHIANGLITGRMMETILSPGSMGSNSFINATFDQRGRVLSYVNKLNITGLSDGQFLRYDVATDRWINTSVSPGALPSGLALDTIRHNGTGWVVNPYLRASGSGLGLGVDIDQPANGLHVASVDGVYIGISNPLSISLTSDPTSGSLLASTKYYYRFRTIDYNGDMSKVTTEADVTVDSFHSSVSIGFNSIPLGVKSIRIYRGTSSAPMTYFDIPISSISSGLIYVDSGGQSMTTSDPGKYESGRSVIIDSNGIHMGLTPTRTPFEVDLFDDTIESVMRLMRTSNYINGNHYVINIESNTASLGSGNDHVGIRIDVSDDVNAADTIALWAVNGRVHIGPKVTASANSILELESSTKGLMLPRLTTAEISAIPVSASDEGLLVFNKTTKAMRYYNGSAWV